MKGIFIHIINIKMNNFISDSLIKTSPMEINVIDSDDQIVSKHNVPMGFRFLEYVRSIYPNDKLIINFINKNFRIEVYINEELFEIYLGIYKTS